MSQAQPFTRAGIDRLPLVGHAVLPTPLGPMVALATAQGLAGLWFDFERHYGGPPPAPLAPELPVLRATAEWLRAFWAGEPESRWPKVALDLHGTPFQQAVWARLLRIGHGRTVSYGEVAQGLGKPAAVRAVGGAVGANPVPLIVPCHRVLGAKGALTGFSAGVERKLALLRHEGVLLA